jgi:predicted acylesterase/phospholipase RssA
MTDWLHTNVRYLVFSGGGLRGTAYIGALRALIRCAPCGWYQRLLGASGTSIGALYALVSCSGKEYQSIDLESFITGYPMHQVFSPDFTQPLDTVKQLGGLDQGNGLREMILGMLALLGQPPDQTFLGYYKSNGGRQFVCWATEVGENNGEPICLSHLTCPSLKLVDGVYASMCLPGVFAPLRLDSTVLVLDQGLDHKPFTFKNHQDASRSKSHKYILVDGGLVNNFPMATFPPDETLGFLLQTTQETIAPGGWQFMFQMMMAPSFILERIQIQSVRDQRRVCRLYTDSFPLWQTSMSREETALLVRQGEIAVEKWLDQWFPPVTPWSLEHVRMLLTPFQLKKSS